MQGLKAMAETSDGKDEAAGAWDDLLEIAGLLERMQSQAKPVFGDQITHCDNEAI